MASQLAKVSHVTMSIVTAQQSLDLTPRRTRGPYFIQSNHGFSADLELDSTCARKPCECKLHNSC